MAINRSKVQAQAQKFVLKGQVDKAIKEYLTLLEDDPSDLKVCQKLGDLYAKKGDKANACEQYNKIAQDYQEKGFYLKAIAVYKQIVRLEPDELGLYLQLGDLYHKQGLAGEAMAQYRIVAGRYEKEGKVQEALEIIGKMADIDPSNVMMRVKLAENYMKEGLKEKALGEVLKAGSELSSKGKHEELINLYEKFAKADQSNKELFKELGKAYIDKGDDAKAIESLKHALKIDPDDASSLSVISELYAKSGDSEKAKLSLQQILRVDASSIDARKALYEIYNSEGDAERAVSEYETIIDIYLKSESFEEALQSVQLLRENHPDNLKVMGKLCEIHRFMNEEDKLVASYKELASMHTSRGEDAQSAGIYEKILELRPDDKDALKQKDKGGVKEEVAETDSEADSDTPLSNSQIGKLLTEVDVYIKYGMEDKAEESIQAILKRNPQSIAARLKLKDFYIGLGKKSEAVEELISVAEIAREASDDKKVLESLKEALKLMPDNKVAGDLYRTITGEDPDSLLADDIDVEIELEVDGDVIELEELIPEEDTSTEDLTSISVADIDEKLEEVDFYIQQDLFEKARLALGAILKIDPDNSLVVEKMKALESMEAEAQTKEAETDKGEAFFDLSSELSSDLDDALGGGGELMGFDSLIDSSQELMAGDVADEDGQTHYDLGIAYKEMGVYDDAINEFMIAMKDEKKVFDAYSMVGLCYMEKGETEEAIGYFRAGLDTDGIPKAAEINLNYELGLACRAAGKMDEARDAIAKVYSADKTFREVEVIFAELGGLGGGGQGGPDGMETVSEKELSDPDKKSKDKVSYI